MYYAWLLWIESLKENPWIVWIGIGILVLGLAFAIWYFVESIK